MRIALFLLVFVTPAAAQAPRLVLREATVVEGFAPAPDTAAMERASLPNEDGAVYLGPVLLELGRGAVLEASLDFDVYTGSPQLSLAMAPREAAAFAALTEARIGKPIAIVLDGRVLAAPTINGTFPNGRVQITGQFTVAEVQSIAQAIREATGPGEPLAEPLHQMRVTVDLSDPYSSAASLFAAARRHDWLAVARVLHPDAMHALREFGSEGLVLEGDSVRALSTGAVIAVRDVLGEKAPGPAWSDYTDPQATALTWALLATQGFWERLDVTGALQDDDGRTFAVVESTDESELERGVSSASVLEFRQVEGEWRLLLPGGGI